MQSIQLVLKEPPVLYSLYEIAAVSIIQVQNYLEYRCKAEIGQAVKTDHGQVMVDNRCWIRAGHTMTQVDPKWNTTPLLL